jgi:hypothetical protein
MRPNPDDPTRFPEGATGGQPIRTPARSPWAVAVVLALLAVGAGFWLHSRQHAAALGRVTCEAGRFTLAEDAGGDLRALDGAQRPDVYYRVTLAAAPSAERLSLVCEWLDPSGRVVLQNHYQTRSITSAVWTTHCHQRLGPESARGAWTARLRLRDRILRSDVFELR